LDVAVLVAVLAVVGLVIFVIARTAVIVPQQSAFVVETLGKYSRTLRAGFHILFPFVERVAYRLSLKEQALDVPEQVCITKDNVQVSVDGILYMQVLEPDRASYGIADYVFAIAQLVQTTLRSEIGKIELDRTFEERGAINANVVTELDKATSPWGVKVLRYEIRNITPPTDVLTAMEKQMRAEREKRAVVLTSEGERDAKINQAEGEKQRVIKESEANRQQQINEAQGQAEAILAVANATAAGLERIARALSQEGGAAAMQLRVAEEYIGQFGNLAKAGNTLVVPANLSDIAGMIALATQVARGTGPAGASGKGAGGGCCSGPSLRSPGSRSSYSAPCSSSPSSPTSGRAASRRSRWGRSATTSRPSRAARWSAGAARSWRGPGTSPPAAGSRP
jgi:regulator of protease activity HflC (stomatin/prohibitin superfamily)